MALSGRREMNRSDYDVERPENYDALVPLVIPRWEEFYETAAGYIPHNARRVLELASGTGILTVKIRERVFGCDITCIDSNPGMIEIARTKQSLCDVRFIEGDIRHAWPEGPFDAVITTQCLIAFSAVERARIAEKAYQNLSDGGLFIDGDVFSPGNQWEFDYYCGRFREFMRTNGLSQEMAEKMIGPLDTLIGDYSVADLRSLLTRAGFSHTAIPYQNELYGIGLGIR